MRLGQSGLDGLLGPLLGPLGEVGEEVPTSFGAGDGVGGLGEAGTEIEGIQSGRNLRADSVQVSDLGCGKWSLTKALDKASLFLYILRGGIPCPTWQR